MPFEMDRQTFQREAENFDLEVRFDYGGRGMYGSTCPGVVGSLSDFLLFVLAIDAIVREEDDIPYVSDAACYLAERVCTDSMGYDTIYYWPGLILVDE